MTWKGRLLQRLAPVLDIAMLPSVWLAAHQMLLIRRATPRRMPRAMRLLGQIGIYPVIDHYYEPLINLERLRAPLSQIRQLTGLDLSADRGLPLLEQVVALADLGETPEGRRERMQYRPENGFFGPLDAAVLHGLIRRYQPRRIVEVGCGISTIVAIKASTRNATDDPGYACDHICIEPYEQPWLADAPVRLLRQTAESCDSALVSALGDGDLLFIDSSHIIRPQGDVVTEILDWLGRLAPGVLVHFHDIFTPRDYPEDLLRVHRFFWNEQYLLEAFLAFNDRFEVLLPLNHIFETFPERIRALCPAQFRPDALIPSSFWFRRLR